MNDRHGHAVGDDALQAVASALRLGLSEGAVLGRLGGEEFGVLLPGADADAATQAAESLRLRIENTRVRHDKFDVTLTASFGLAALSSTVSSLEALLATADTALYRAKRNGRNRVCAAQDGMLAGS